MDSFFPWGGSGRTKAPTKKVPVPARIHTRTAVSSNESLLLTFTQVALRAKIAPDEAKDEDFGDSKARTTTKYGAICAATLRAGANFPLLFVARC
jgi:hypothetical protein